MGTDRGIGVIGGGPAGLAAAWRLSAAGRRVVIYEARDRAGGRLRTEVVGGVGADAVVQLLSDGYDALAGMLSELGLSDRLTRVPGRDALWRGGRAHPLRYGSVTSMAASGALPTRLKVRMGMRYVPFLERNAEVLELNDPGRAAAAGLDDESIAEWGRREVGDDFVELLAYPLLAAYYGVTPEETSAGMFHALARAGLRVRVLGIRGGAGPLAESMARALAPRGVELRTGAAVDSVEPVEGGVRLGTAGGAVEHEAVVVAIPALAASQLVPEARLLADVRSRSTATLILALDEEVRPGWFGLSIPRSEPEGERIAALCVQAEKGTGLAEAGGGSVVVVPAPEEGARWALSEPAAALESALPVAERVLPGVRRRVMEARLVRLRGSTFVPEPGHFGRVRRLGLDPAALPSRLALAGDYMVAPTVEGAVRSGLQAADRVMDAAW